MQKNTYTRIKPHSVCGNSEFYTATGKCVFCCRKFSAEAKLRSMKGESSGAPNMHITLADAWLRKSLTGGAK